MSDIRVERYYQVAADSPFAAVGAVKEPEIFDASCVKVKTIDAEAHYGGSLFRWLLGRPKFYDVTVTFTIQRGGRL